MAQKIKKATLIVYPDSDYGFLFQFPETTAGSRSGREFTRSQHRCAAARLSFEGETTTTSPLRSRSRSR
jgi:hypothetical protein